MIASFSRNFIFVKTRKTAGTSIEIMLSQFCGADDILTPITPDDEMLRAARGGVIAQNYSVNPALEAAYRDAVLRHDLNAAAESRALALKKSRFYNHMPAVQVRDNVTADFWASAFKFTIERHPYEKVVSRAYWDMARQDNPLPFDEMLDEVAYHGDYDDSGLYTEAGAIIVDQIFRQEDLPRAALEMCRAIGVEGTTLERAKGHHRQDRRPARDILTEGQKQKIRERSAFSFDVLGYDP